MPAGIVNECLDRHDHTRHAFFQFIVFIITNSSQHTRFCNTKGGKTPMLLTEGLKNSVGISVVLLQIALVSQILVNPGGHYLMPLYGIMIKVQEVAVYPLCPA